PPKTVHRGRESISAVMQIPTITNTRPQSWMMGVQAMANTIKACGRRKCSD
ncbi:hypothetical protein L195_g064133, partial [Trifolium pratense]